MDLHAWITQQVDRVERTAQAADRLLRNLISQVEYVDAEVRADGQHIDTHLPAAVLRRCEADPRILDRHAPQPNGTGFDDGWQCRTCSVDGGDGYQYLVPYPCPTVEDLAHAHGITPDVLAGLDHPRPPEPDVNERYANGGTLTPSITTSDVPAAPRGPRWKS